MNLLGLLQSALYVISEALLYPVIVVLLFFFGLIIYRCGEIFSEHLRRRYIHIPEPKNAGNLFAETADLSILSPAVRQFVKAIKTLPPVQREREIEIEYRLRESQEKLSWELARYRGIVRLAPMIGLMGTLIPMGSALAALTEGNLAVMANNLIIAFTTTVVGLFLGGVAYLLTLYKGRWVAQDRRCMDLLAELALQAGSPE